LHKKESRRSLRRRINARFVKKEVERSLREVINAHFAEKRERTVVEKADQSPF
jgi:hypothetical protein